MIVPIKTILLVGLLVLVLEHGKQCFPMTSAQITQQRLCSYDYFPCTCTIEGKIGISKPEAIYCISTPISEVVKVFNETLPQYNFNTFFLLDFSPTGEGLPNNFLGYERVILSINIQCINFQPLYIADDAFKATKYATYGLSITGCNLRDSNMVFLEGFVALVELNLNTIDGMGSIFPKFPIRLSKMVSLKMNNCSGWNNLMNIPQEMFNGNLGELSLSGSYDMNDAAMSIVLDWAVLSFKWTVNGLYTNNNNLKKIPHQMGSFIHLNFVDLSGNAFPSILTRSLAFESRAEIKLLVLSNCEIEEIEPGAFQGNFTKALIDLGGNNLTRFESSVFHNILQAGGSVEVKGNPFNCDEDPCHLAWIFNENFLSSVFNARCSNGTLFQLLDNSFFIECQVFLSTKGLQSSQQTDETLVPSTHLTNEISSNSSYDQPTLIWSTKESNYSTVVQFTFPTSPSYLSSLTTPLVAIGSTYENTMTPENSTMTYLSTSELPKSNVPPMYSTCYVLNYLTTFFYIWHYFVILI